MSKEQKMTKEDFDQLLKENNKDDSLFGYSTLPIYEEEYKSHYYKLYYSNKEFWHFCQEMKDKYAYIYKAYAKGKGSELVGAPPKMASVASSSRFCYLALRNASIEDFGEKIKGEKSKFKFEEDLKVDCIKGTNPQMDAFYEDEDSVYFFEFKCHEIFDKHEDTISEQYNIFFEDWEMNRVNTDIPVRDFGIDEIKMFDLKQFITHLTGIIKHEANGKRKVFAYVYFWPDKHETNSKLKEIYDNLMKEVNNVFSAEKVQKICKENQIELRLYYYKNDVMNGFEEQVKPCLILQKG